MAGPIIGFAVTYRMDESHVQTCGKLKHSLLNLLADDTLIYRHDKSKGKLIDDLNDDIKNINDYAKMD